MRMNSVVQKLFILFLLGFFCACGGGTSGSTPIGGSSGGGLGLESAVGLRVQLVSKDGEAISQELVALIGSSQQVVTNSSGIAAFEVEEEDELKLSIGSGEKRKPLSLEAVSEGVTFVGVIVQPGVASGGILKQVEMRVEAEGPCAELLKQKDGIDFFLQRDFSGSVECLFRIFESEGGAINPNLRGWRASIACGGSEGDGSERPTDLGVEALVQPDGFSEIRLPLEEEKKGCEVMFRRVFTEEPTVSPLNDAFNPRVILRPLSY